MQIQVGTGLERKHECHICKEDVEIRSEINNFIQRVKVRWRGHVLWSELKVNFFSCVSDVFLCLCLCIIVNDI